MNGTQLAATTVLFDPKRDIAVLYVPGLQARALAFAECTEGAEAPLALILQSAPSDTTMPCEPPGDAP